MTVPSLGSSIISPQFPLPGLSKKLKVIDFIIEVERLEALRLLRQFYDRSREYEIEPEFYQVYGIAISSEDSLACKKAQILAINGCFGKYDLSKLSELDISIDWAAVRERIPDLFLLRSIRWYLSTAQNLIEWASPKALEPLFDIEAIGHDCVAAALNEDGHFEVIQFYLAILPFSKDKKLREKISRLEPFLDIDSKDYLREQLFALDAISMAQDNTFSHVSREAFYQDKMNRLKTILEKINGHEIACQYFKEDLKLKVKSTALILYCEARLLGLNSGINIESYVSSLAKDALSAKKPNAVHVQALNIALKAFTILSKSDKIFEIKQKLYSLINKIKS